MISRTDIINVPKEPGVYLFYNKSNKIIYVGKAKNLKNRISSYFIKNLQNAKVKSLILNIDKFTYFIVEDEQEALLLENNLIKRHQPRYNILLKDDKTYPWISIKKEPFPRIIITRTYLKNSSNYFGPYTSVKVIKNLLNLIRNIYPLRDCSLDLVKTKILKNIYKPCLQYHLGNCLAPCVNLQSEEDYNSNINQIIKILKGDIFNVITQLKDKIIYFSNRLDFESANSIKSKIELLERYKNRNTVISNKISNVDVFSIYEINDLFYINYLKIIDGSIINLYNIKIKRKLNESHEDILVTLITEIRNKFKSESIEIITKFPIRMKFKNIIYTVPHKGDKLKLLELSYKNAIEYSRQDINNFKINTKKANINELLLQIKNDLSLSKLPDYIECFDNSNIQGKNPVASCIVYKNLEPSINDYIHFNIKTVKGPNDFASMQEIVYRRYSRLIKEKKQLPNLIVIDGGIGQLNAALKSLKDLNLINTIDILSIAKRNEEIFKPLINEPIILPSNSVSLKIIQNVRNEAHRFGIKFHKIKRTNDMISSELNEIKGVGEKTINKILNIYKSIYYLKKINEEELTKLIGIKKTRIIQNYFNKQ